MKARIELRRFRESDLALIAAWARQKEVWQAAMIGKYAPIQPNDPAVRNWFAQHLRANEHAFVIERASDAVPIGTVGFKRCADGEAEIEITIGEIAEWGKGYGKEALRMLLRRGFDEMKLNRIFGTVLRTNERALAFYRALGFSESPGPEAMITVSINRVEYRANLAAPVDRDKSA